MKLDTWNDVAETRIQLRLPDDGDWLFMIVGQHNRDSGAVVVVW